ncbi:MAG: hypothetical protein AAF940_04370 [Pseudomonadota bacterium]
MGRSDLAKRQERLAAASRIMQLKAKMAQSELGAALREEADLKRRIDQCEHYLARSDLLALSLQPVVASEYKALLSALAVLAAKTARLRAEASTHQLRSDKVDEKLGAAKALVTRSQQERQNHEQVIEHHMRRKPRTS